MREAMGADEFAAFTGVDPADLERYREAGLVDLDRDGRFDAEDVLRLQIVLHYVEDEGRPLEEVADVARTSGGAVGGRIFPAEPPMPIDEVGDRLGLDEDRLQAIATALGVPAGPLDDRDLRDLAAGVRMMEAGLPWEAMLEGARVYGDALRKLTEAEIRLAHRFLCEPMTRGGASDREVTKAFLDAVEMIEPNADLLIRHLIGDFRTRAAVSHALEHVQASGAGRAPGSLEAAIVFVDLSSFTPLTEAHGDLVAAEVLDRFDGIVRAVAVRNNGSVVKQLGDEFMLAFGEAADAARFASEVLDATAEETDFPGLRIGVHTGPVLYRTGDYVGSNVNVAARVTAMAMPGTVLLTEPVAEAARTAGLATEELGVRRAKGVEQPLVLHRLVRPAAPGVADPVCGTVVGPEAAASLRHEGAELAFCSSDCLRRFLEDPDRYAIAG